MRRFFSTVTHLQRSLSLTLVLSLILTSTSLANQPRDPRDFRGRVWSDTKDSTGILHYDFTAYNLDPDSVHLLIDSDTIAVFRRDTAETPLYDRSHPLAESHELLLEGSTPYSFASTARPPSIADIESFYQNEADSTIRFKRRVCLYDNMSYVAAGFTVPLASYGWCGSTLDDPLAFNGPLVGLSGSTGLVSPQWSLMVHSKVNIGGKSGASLSLSEPIRGEIRLRPRSHGHFIPELTLGGGLALLRVEHNDRVFRRIQWGADFGAAIRVPFYQLSYRYSSALNGYHTAELFIAYKDAMHSGFGTAYEFQTDGDIWTVSATFRFNLVAKVLGSGEKGSGTTLYRHDNRPGVIRALSLAGAVVCLPWIVSMGGL